jgi:hypothetical protein
MYGLSCHEISGKMLFRLGSQTLKTFTIKEVDFAAAYIVCTMEMSQRKKNEIKKNIDYVRMN